MKMITLRRRALPTPESSQRQQLTDLSASTLAGAFKAAPFAETLLRLALRTPAREIADTVLTFDQLAAGAGGMKAASEWLMETWTDGWTARGVECVPADGPLLLVSNHPGLNDSMAVLSALPRGDVRVIARTRNLLDALPGVQRHIIFVPEQERYGLGTLRETIRQLQDGGVVLTFPRGHIEPDPLLHRTDALAALPQWHESADFLARHVPGLRVVPVAVGGVINERATQAPISRLYRKQADRDWVAATLQLMLPRYRDVHVQVAFGEPLPADSPNLTAAVRAQMHHLIHRL